MTMTTLGHKDSAMTLKTLAAAALRTADSVPHSLLAVISRFAVATVFWRSAQSKVDGWEITPSTFQLFKMEYQVPLLPPEVAAYLATIGEHLFSVLLVIGLASRLGALGLLGMTAVIQIFVYPESWPDHILWTSALLYIVARGPGILSIDHFVRRRLLPER